MRPLTRQAIFGICGSAVVFIGLLTWLLSRDSGTRARLIYSLGPIRPLEGRLSGVAFAPYVPNQPVAVPPARLRAALRSSKSLPGRYSESESLRFNAVLNILAGKPAQAIQILEERSDKTKDPRVLSDLSAVYLERARKDQDGELLLLAIETAYRALKEDPRLHEALFNKALSLETAGLEQISRFAWIEYLQQDDSSPWATEAKAHIQHLARRSRRSAWEFQRQALVKAATAGQSKLVSQIVSQFPDLARAYGEEEVLASWALAESTGQTALASEALGIARSLGDALATLGGDELLRDTAAEIWAAEKDGNLAKIRLLVAGFVSFKQGLEQFRLDNFEVAASELDRSVAMLRHAGSRAFAWPSLYRAICDYYAAKYQSAITSLRSLQGEVNKETYPALAGRALWIEGLVQFSLSDFLEAMGAHTLSISLYQRSKEGVTAGYINSLLAADLSGLGESKEAWRYRFVALSVLPEMEDPRRIYSILQVAADIAVEERRFAVAVDLYNELLLRTRDWKLPTGVLVETLARRSALLGRIGRNEQALQDLAKARKLASKIQDSAFRQRVNADLNVAEAGVELPRHPHEAAGLLTEVLGFYAATSYHAENAEALAQRARAYSALGDPAAAKADLDRGISDLERERERSGSDLESSRYFNQIQELFEERVTLELEAPSTPGQAFTYAERARVGPWMRLGNGDLTEEDVQHSLPTGVVLIEYMVLPDRLLVWGIGREKKFVVQEVGSEALERMVNDFRLSVLSGRSGNKLAVQLYGLLINPVADLLDAGARHIVIVPDKFLQGLPYAALFDPGARRFLVEKFSLTLSSSSRRFLDSSEARSEVSQGEASALVVDATNVSPGVFPFLPQLTAAKNEVTAIAGLYPKSAVLSGDDATRRRFIQAISGYDIVHFSGHAISEPIPGLSALVLAPKGSETGLLRAQDLAKVQLRKACLVVLAGCSTAMGKELREGGINLAELFLRAGASTVIASVWDAGDIATSKLLLRFHRYLLTGHHASEALRLAQIDAIRSGSSVSPASWAGFEALGGDFAFSYSE